MPAGPVNTMEDIFADPHVAAREMLPEIEQVGANAVQARRARRSSSRRRLRGIYSRAPVLGEHARRSSPRSA